MKDYGNGNSGKFTGSQSIREREFPHFPYGNGAGIGTLIIIVLSNDGGTDNENFVKDIVHDNFTIGNASSISNTLK